MRGSVTLVTIAFAVLLVGCGEDAEPFAFPSQPQGRLLTPTASETPDAGQDAPATFDADGCPVDERRMCEEAATLAAALAQVNLDAVFTLSRPTTIPCADADPEVYPQCDDRGTKVLEGYAIGPGADPETFVAPEKDYRETLGFMADGVDEEFSDEFGGSEYQIVGVATCEPGVRYQLSYLVGLGDPESTLPADRFFGTFELTEQDRGWAISKLTLSLLSDWQLTFDDPLSDAGCGRIEGWDA